MSEARRVLTQSAPRPTAVLEPRRAEQALPARPTPHPPHPSGRPWLSRLVGRLVLVDLVVLAGSLATALYVRFGVGASSAQVQGLRGQVPLRSYAWLSLVLGAGWLFSLVAARTYDRRMLGVGVDEYKRVVSASLRFWGVVAIVSYLGRLELARGFLAVAFPLGTLLLVVGRFAARKVLHRSRRRSTAWSHRVLVVGDRSSVVDLVHQLRRAPYSGLDVVGACVPPLIGGEFRRDDDLPVVGTLDDVADAVVRTGADTVAVTSGGGVSSSVVKRLGWDLEGAGVDLVVAPSLVDVAGPRVHVRPVAGLPLLHVEQPEFTGLGRVAKGLFDRLVALVLVVLLAPFFAVTMLAIRVSSPGPAIFRQQRVGLKGRIFTLYKFRSMAIDAEDRLVALMSDNEGSGHLFKLHCDPRVTRVGRWLRRYSIDELPQLWNVLKGDMSLVGPRPALPSETAQYGDDVRRRLLVRPGMTGLWQVSGRSDLSWEDSVRLDLYYVENWAFTGDVAILWKTISAVMSSRGAY